MITVMITTNALRYAVPTGDLRAEGGGHPTNGFLPASVRLLT